MAGASGKKTKASNSTQLSILQTGVYITIAIYLLHLLLFTSGRSSSRLFYFVSSLGIELFVWKQLQGVAKHGDLSADGLTAYMFDVIYISWFVHTTTALISAKFWYFYLSIPMYVIYRGLSFMGLIPSTNKSAPATSGAQPIQTKPTEEVVEKESKRQEKLRLKREKGPIRIVKQ